MIKRQWKIPPKYMGSGKKRIQYIILANTRLRSLRKQKLKSLVEQQGHRCCYCHRKIWIGDWVKPNPMPRDQMATLDHIIPYCTPTQTNKDENLVAACERCNVNRGNINALDFYNRIHNGGFAKNALRKRTRKRLLKKEQRYQRFEAKRPEKLREKEQKTIHLLLIALKLNGSKELENAVFAKESFHNKLHTKLIIQPQEN